MYYIASVGAQNVAQVQVCGVSMKAGIKFFIAILGVMSTLPVMASGSGPALAEGVNYIPLEPALVVNYGGPGKARFIKAELSIRTETGEDAAEVMHHLPLIRDRLVSILSAQTEEAISTAEGKEYLRVYALAEINKALLKVEGHSVDEHDEKHSEAAHGKETIKKSETNDGTAVKNADAKDDSAGTAMHNETKEAGNKSAEAAAVPSIADIKPVKGPASDLFFNNFVVQK
jgi:flagellar basal body-associated protein FliL